MRVPTETALIAMDAISTELPEEMAAAADWNLKMSDGTLIPCHSFCLCAVSPVLAFTLATSSKDVQVPVPATISQDAVFVFLRWVYRLKYVLTPATAHQLALLCDEWDVQGEKKRKKYASSLEP